MMAKLLFVQYSNGGIQFAVSVVGGEQVWLSWVCTSGAACAWGWSLLDMQSLAWAGWELAMTCWKALMKKCGSP